MMPANAAGLLQKRLAMKILEAGRKKVWLDPTQIPKIQAARTRESVRKLVDEGLIKRKWAPNERPPFYYDFLFNRISLNSYTRKKHGADNLYFVPKKGSSS